MDHDCKLNFGCCWNYRPLFSYRVDGAADRWVHSAKSNWSRGIPSKVQFHCGATSTCPGTVRKTWQQTRIFIMLILTYRGLMTLMSSSQPWMLTLTCEKKKYIFMYCIYISKGKQACEGHGHYCGSTDHLPGFIHGLLLPLLLSLYINDCDLD